LYNETEGFAIHSCPIVEKLNSQKIKITGLINSPLSGLLYFKKLGFVGPLFVCRRSF
jgi:hypothetical protein